MPSLFSLDIYDTLLTSYTAESAGVFALIEKNLQNDLTYNDLPNDIRQNFYLLRQRAEIIAKKRLAEKNQAYTLDTIYQIISLKYPLTQDQIRRLELLEIATAKVFIRDLCQKVLEVPPQSKKTSASGSDSDDSFDTMQRLIETEINQFNYTKELDKTYKKIYGIYHNVLNTYLRRLKIPDKCSYYDFYLVYLERIGLHRDIIQQIRRYLQRKGANIAPFFNAQRTGLIATRKLPSTPVYQYQHQRIA